MSLILETGEGVPDSNSYLSITEAEDILTDLGYDTFPAESDLINASLYLDTYLDPASFILTEGQGLLWPREPFTDNQGRTIEGIPKAIKRAVAIISMEFMEEDLFDIEPAVISESYGNSSVEFVAPQSKPGRVVSQLSYLKSLGYGGSNTTSVRLVRA
jgi:hypothetical protein